MNKRWKKRLAVVAFLGLQLGAISAAITGMWAIGHVNVARKIVATNPATYTWGFWSNLGTGALTTIAAVCILSVLGFFGWLLYKWGEWTYEKGLEYYEDWEYKKQIARRAAEAEASRRIQQGEISNSWEL